MSSIILNHDALLSFFHETISQNRNIYPQFVESMNHKTLVGNPNQRLLVLKEFFKFNYNDIDWDIDDRKGPGQFVKTIAKNLTGRQKFRTISGAQIESFKIKYPLRQIKR